MNWVNLATELSSLWLPSVDLKPSEILHLIRHYWPDVDVAKLEHKAQAVLAKAKGTFERRGRSGSST